jgi:hypothetical protein
VLWANTTPGTNRAITANTANSLLKVVNRIAYPPGTFLIQNRALAPWPVSWAQSRDPMNCKAF